jgi:hydrogenase expression/formation protein HypD
MRPLLPESIQVISGPGCPVCVVPASQIATAIKLADEGDLITTFGDMFKVPDGRLNSLSKAKARGANIRIVYSVRDAISLATKHPTRRVIWLGVGFETTAPMTSFVLEKGPPENFQLLSDFRLVPPALRSLIDMPTFDLDGFILPGHVCAVTGWQYFDEFASRYEIPCVVAGFDPIEFLVALDKLLDQLISGNPQVYNAYPHVVTKDGNRKAQRSMDKVFDIVDSSWRGIGTIEQSGLELKNKYEKHDAYQIIGKVSQQSDLPKGCLCGAVILGQTNPQECPHYLRRCSPNNAIGPCMVSDEGTCRIRATYQELEQLAK